MIRKVKPILLTNILSRKFAGAALVVSLVACVGTVAGIGELPTQEDSTQATVVLDATALRFVGGVNELERSRVFNIIHDGLQALDEDNSITERDQVFGHAQLPPDANPFEIGDLNPAEGLGYGAHTPPGTADYVFDELRINPGRAFGIVRGFSFWGDLREDPERPGYIDPESIEETAALFREKLAEKRTIREKFDTLDVAEHGFMQGDLYPHLEKFGEPVGDEHFRERFGGLHKYPLPANAEAYAEFAARV